MVLIFSTVSLKLGGYGMAVAGVEMLMVPSGGCIGGLMMELAVKLVWDSALLEVKGVDMFGPFVKPFSRGEGGFRVREF